MLTKISKLHLSYSTKSCRHTLSPNEKILRHIYFFVAFCDNGDRQSEPCPWGGAKFDPRTIIWATLVETQQIRLHAKFGKPWPYD